MKIYFYLIFLFSFTIQTFSQNSIITGKVTDSKTGEPLMGVSVGILKSKNGVFTDSLGIFSLNVRSEEKCTLVSYYLGYISDTLSIDLGVEKVYVDVMLKRNEISLDEIMINGLRGTNGTLHSNQTSKGRMDIDPLKLLTASSGLATMNIGANISKPIIRGLGFDRVAVYNRGIMQQNQQWGSDHGLDIDLLDLKSIRIYKGPSALLLGNSSLSTIEIIPNGFESKLRSFYGEASFIGGSNNALWGGGLVAEFLKNKWYGRITYGRKDYGDYRIANNSIQTDDGIVELIDKYIPNTGGKERTATGTLGYKNKDITSYINVSNHYKKNGIFEVEHHHEHEGDDTDDHEVDPHIQKISTHGVDLPYAESNHFALTNNTEWKKNDNLRFLLNAGFQYNNRKEYEEFHAHYTGQQPPTSDTDLAVNFKLRTYSANARLYIDEDKSWSKIIGGNIEYLRNRIAGYEYFLPTYDQLTGGLSFVNKKQISKKWNVEAGFRYDINSLKTKGFYDTAIADYLIAKGYDKYYVELNSQRSQSVDRTLGNWSGSIGGTYLGHNFRMKILLGKSVKFPSVNELTANGVHHAAYRYEIGDPNLKSENSYSLEFGVEYDRRVFSIEINPFINYYSNFIHLATFNDDYSAILYDEKAYKYSQAKAVFAGTEFNLRLSLTPYITLSSGGNLVFNRNLDTHEYLPFTPPFTMINEVKYANPIKSKQRITNYQISISHKLYATQNRVALGEQQTDGANLFNLHAGLEYELSKNMSLNIGLQLNNIFNTSYLNHLSLYRRIHVPEQGRNFMMSIRVPFIL